MAEGGEQMDLVADLLSKPFSRRTFQEKRDIVKQGRATTKLASLSQPGKRFVRHFQSTTSGSWITGSEDLLFATERDGVWSHTGFSNLSCLSKAAMRHQSTAGVVPSGRRPGHFRATVLSKTFRETSGSSAERAGA